MELKARPEGSRPTRSHRAYPQSPKRQGQGEDLRDALDREAGVGITCVIFTPIAGTDADGKLLGVDARQFRNVAGDVAPLVTGSSLAVEGLDQ